MKKFFMIIVLLLLFVVSVSASPVDTVYKFGNYEGMLHNDLLVVSAKLSGGDCLENYDSSVCNSDVGIQLSIDPEYSGYVPTRDDAVGRMSFSVGENVVDDGVVLAYPYHYYSCLVNDNYNNNEFINQYVDFGTTVGLSDYIGGFNSLPISNNLRSVSNQNYIYDVSDAFHFTALDHGFSNNRFGSVVCDNSFVVPSFSNKGYYYSEPSYVFDDVCDVASFDRDEWYLYDFDKAYYGNAINFNVFPFRFYEVDVVCNYVDGSSNNYVFQDAVDNEFYSYAPNIDWFEVVPDSSYFSSEKTYLPTTFKSGSGFDGFYSCVDTGVDVSNIDVSIYYEKNNVYRHKTPLDYTSFWSDIFFSGLSFNDDGIGILSLSLDVSNNNNSVSDDNFVSSSVDFNVSVDADTSSSLSDVGGIVVSSSGSNSDSSDNVDNMLSVAKARAFISGESNVFDNLLSIAISLFGFFLLIYSFIVIILFFGFVLLLMFGLWRSVYRAVDDVFDVVEGGFK